VIVAFSETITIAIDDTIDVYRHRTYIGLHANNITLHTYNSTLLVLTVSPTLYTDPTVTTHRTSGLSD